MARQQEHLKARPRSRSKILAQRTIAMRHRWSQTSWRHAQPYDCRATSKWMRPRASHRRKACRLASRVTCKWPSVKSTSERVALHAVPVGVGGRRMVPSDEPPLPPRQPNRRSVSAPAARSSLLDPPERHPRCPRRVLSHTPSAAPPPTARTKLFCSSF